MAVSQTASLYLAEVHVLRRRCLLLVHGTSSRSASIKPIGVLAFVNWDVVPADAD